MVFSGPLVRSSYMADMVSERSAPESRLNYVLALASAAAAGADLSAIQPRLLAPVALAPLLVAVAREAGRARRFLLGWIAGSSTGSASATGFSSCSRITAAWARPWAGRLPAVLRCSRRLHMGVFALLRRDADAALVGRAGGAGAVGGDRE